MTNRYLRVLLAIFAAALLSATTFGQNLVVAQGTDPVTLDPRNATDSPTATVLSHIYETLFDLTPDGDIVPLLATNAEMSADGTSWTISLRDDVTFHNGAPLTADVVKFSVERFI